MLKEHLLQSERRLVAHRLGGYGHHREQLAFKSETPQQFHGAMNRSVWTEDERVQFEKIAMQSRAKKHIVTKQRPRAVRAGQRSAGGDAGPGYKAGGAGAAAAGGAGSRAELLAEALNIEELPTMLFGDST